MLHDVEHLSTVIDLDEHTKFVKQRSEKWKHLRSQSSITASTMYTTLGFRGVNEMKLHFREFILKQNDRVLDPLSIQRMQ